MAEAILNQPQFQDAEKAREHLEALRWPNGPICPHCGSVRTPLKLEGKSYRPGLFKCGDCYEQFTVTVGTVFERSKIKLNIWLQAVHLMCASKKGISAKQLERMLGVTYKTAWFMAHRIREAMTAEMAGPMGGSGKIVEADETYWGSEGGSKVQAKKANPAARRSGAVLKDANKVVALVERGGHVRAFHVPSVTGQNLKIVLETQIHPDTHVMTDASPRYNLLKREHGFKAYDQINHSKHEYARGIVTTNTVEGFFSVFKRGLVGTFHHVAPKHLQRYTDEFSFRFNTRQALGFSDTDRANIALKNIAGKRLTYRRIGEQQVPNA
jgi:transposase-like protein